MNELQQDNYYYYQEKPQTYMTCRLSLLVPLIPTVF